MASKQLSNHELADLLDRVAMLSEPIYLAGDLNIHLERSDDTYTTRLVDLLDTYGLDIRVSESTHELGGILDDVVSR